MHILYRSTLLVLVLACTAACAPMHNAAQSDPPTLKQKLLGQFSSPGEEQVAPQASGLAAWANPLTAVLADWNPYKGEGSSSRGTRSRLAKDEDKTYYPPLAPAKIKMSDFLHRGVKLHFRGPGKMTAEQQHMSVLFPLRMMQLQIAHEYGERLGIMVEDGSHGGDAQIYLGLTKKLSDLDDRSRYLDDRREDVTKQIFFLRLSSYTKLKCAPHIIEYDPAFIRQTAIQAAYVLMMHARSMGFDLEKLEDRRGTRSSNPVIDFGADLRRSNWL